MISWIIEQVLWLLGLWPYWLPVVTFSFGWGLGTGFEVINTQSKLERLARGVNVPKGWRGGPIRTSLDGEARSKEEMAKAAFVIRTDLGHGSGVCISSNGLILTNAHVIGDAKIVEVEDEGNSYLGVVLKRNRKRDAAVLLIEATGLQPVRIASTPARVGDDLFVSGTPDRLENRNILTRGLVSKVGDYGGSTYIHMDAHIAGGNSGGPVFNADGCLVGITVAYQIAPDGSKSHINLAIPIAEFLDSVNIQDQAEDPDCEQRAVEAQSLAPEA